MKDIKEIIKFTINEIIHKKIFIVTNIIILVLILLLVNAPNLLKTFNVDLSSLYTEKVLIIDENNIMENSVESLNSEDSYITYEVINEAYSEDTLKTELEEGKYNYALELNKENSNVNIKYIDDTSLATNSKDFNISLIESLYTDLQISKLDLTEDEKININPVFIYDELNLSETEGEETSSGSAVSIGMLLSFVLFFTVYLFAFQVSSAVTTEKTSKIVETLLTSTSSKNIILGKTIGVGILGLTQILVILIFTYISATLFLPADIINGIINLSDLTFTVVFIGILYFVLGYLLFSFLFALAGATVNRLEDVQLANTPISLISILGFYLGYFSGLTPTSSINMIASYIPISSPFSMPARYLLGLASETELLISIIILVVTIIIIANISIRIYSSAILNTGSKMNIKSLIKMYKDKSEL